MGELKPLCGAVPFKFFRVMLESTQFNKPSGYFSFLKGYMLYMLNICMI